MKYIFLLCISLVFFFFAFPAYADDSLTPSPSPSVSPTPSMPSDFKESSINILTYLNSFLGNLDKLGGGLVFATPDVFGDTITLPNGESFTGFNNIRNVFYVIAASIIALILCIIGVDIATNESPFQMQPLLYRLGVTALLFASTPFILSLTITGNNLLNDEIRTIGTQGTTSLTITQSAISIFTDIMKQVTAGASPMDFGMPSVSINLFSNFLGSLTALVFQSFVFLATIFFFLLGMFFILFQFVIRFISLLFLSILFPLVIPFALSKKTEGVVKTYFLAWVSFLIHQPAFVLGYVIVLSILNDLLSKQGASLGLLVLYSGMLFFLGGVNGLITRIFGNPWTALSTNIQAAILGGVIPAGVAKFKQGMMGGHVSGLTSLAGRSIGRQMNWLSRDGRDFNISGVTKKNSKEENTTGEGTSIAETGRKDAQDSATPQLALPDFARELQARNISTEIINKRQGMVKIAETKGFAYTNLQNGMTAKYFSKEDALVDGRKGSELRPTTIKGTFIDQSAFSKRNPSPYNTYVSQKAKKLHITPNPHLTLTSSEDRINSFLDLGKDKLKEDGAQGIMIKRYGNNNGIQSKDRVIRVYSKE